MFDINLVKEPLKVAGAFMARNLPSILTYTGVGGVVVSTVMVGKKSRSLDKLLEDDYRRIELVNGRDYSADPQMGVKHKALVYGTMFRKLVIHYALPIGIGAVSIASILYAQNMMRERLAVAISVAKAAQLSFQYYRKNVATVFGTAVDDAMMAGITDLDQIEKVDPQSPEQQTKVQERYGRNDEPDPYFEFVPGSQEFDVNRPTMNHFHIETAFRFANQKLHTDGFVTLNEVRAYFGLPPTSLGLVYGWTWNARDGELGVEEIPINYTDIDGDPHNGFRIYTDSCRPIWDRIDTVIDNIGKWVKS